MAHRSTRYPLGSTGCVSNATLPTALLVLVRRRRPPIADRGAKPNAPQSAGATKPPLQRQDDGGGSKGESPGIGLQLNGPMTVQANDADKFVYTLQK